MLQNDFRNYSAIIFKSIPKDTLFLLFCVDLFRIIIALTHLVLIFEAKRAPWLAAISWRNEP